MMVRAGAIAAGAVPIAVPLTGRRTAEVILLSVGVAAELLFALGVLLARDTFDRLHFSAAAGVAGQIPICAAVVVGAGLSATGVKALLIAGVLLVMNPILTHATARAARTRRFGEVRARPSEQVERS